MENAFVFIHFLAVEVQCREGWRLDPNGAGEGAARGKERFGAAKTTHPAARHCVCVCVCVCVCGGGGGSTRASIHVERFIIEEGHTVERMTADYGYDLTTYTYDEEGYVEEGAVYLQLKAAVTLTGSGHDFVFDIDRRDYALWTSEPMPVILVLFEASLRRACWVYLQRYFAVDASRRPGSTARTIRVRVPKRQAVSRAAVRKWRSYKQRVLQQVEGRIDHA